MRKIYFLIFSFIGMLTTARGQGAGTALDYDGIDDFTTLPANVLTGVTGDFTVEAWVYWRSGRTTPPITGGGWQRIIDFGLDGNNWIVLTPAMPNGQPRFGIDVGGAVQAIDGPVGSFTTDTWHHIAITVNDATDVITMYLDGTAIATQGGFTFHLSDVTSTPNDWIGRSEYPDPYFNGIIDELRVSSSVRYTGNFSPVPHLQFSSDPSTVLLYHFNEGSGQTTADASGHFSAAFLGSNNTVESSDPTWVTTSILPLKLLDFTALANKSSRHADLKWIASIEHNGEFEIERSSNGKDFTVVSRIINQTASTEVQSFSYTDTHPLEGRSYYRLKYNEPGLASVYSRTLAVNFGDNGELLVYPNPVRGTMLTVELDKLYTANAGLVMTNASGAIVMSRQVKLANTKEITVNRNGLPAGTYILEVTVNGVKTSKTVLFQ